MSPPHHPPTHAARAQTTVFLLNAAVAAVGLTLTAASHVYIVSMAYGVQHQQLALLGWHSTNIYMLLYHQQLALGAVLGACLGAKAGRGGRGSCIVTSSHSRGWAGAAAQSAQASSTLAAFRSTTCTQAMAMVMRGPRARVPRLQLAAPHEPSCALLHMPRPPSLQPQAPDQSMPTHTHTYEPPQTPHVCCRFIITRRTYAAPQMEPSLNPSLEVQAIGRAHRLGQTQPVVVTRFLMAGSVEERIKELMDARAEANTLHAFATATERQVGGAGRGRCVRGRGGLLAPAISHVLWCSSLWRAGAAREEGGAVLSVAVVCEVHCPAVRRAMAPNCSCAGVRTAGAQGTSHSAILHLAPRSTCTRHRAAAGNGMDHGGHAGAVRGQEGRQAEEGHGRARARRDRQGGVAAGAARAGAGSGPGVWEGRGRGGWPCMSAASNVCTCLQALRPTPGQQSMREKEARRRHMTRASEDPPPPCATVLLRCRPPFPAPLTSQPHAPLPPPHLGRPGRVHAWHAGGRGAPQVSRSCSGFRFQGPRPRLAAAAPANSRGVRKLATSAQPQQPGTRAEPCCARAPSPGKRRQWDGLRLGLGA